MNFRAPFLFNRNFGLAINYNNLTTEEPVFLENGTADYKYNNTSYEILGLYQFSFNHRIELGANYFNEDYEYKSGATADGVPQDFNVNKLLFKGIYDYDNLNYHFQMMMQAHYLTKTIILVQDHLQQLIQLALQMDL